MKGILILVSVFTFGCAATQLGDEKYSAGDLEGAIQAYDDASASDLTEAEHRSVNVARRKVYADKLDLDFEAIRKLSLSRSEKRKKLITLYGQAVSETYSSILRDKIEAESLLLAKDEIIAIHKLIDAKNIDDALRQTESLFSTLIESGPAVEQLLGIRLHATSMLKALAKNELSADTKLLLNAIAARCERHEIFPAESFSNPSFALRGQVGDIEVKLEAAGPEVVFRGQYNTKRSSQTLSENFNYQEFVKKTFHKKSCTKSTTYVKTRTQSRGYRVTMNKGWATGQYFTQFSTVQTPVSSTSCANVPYVTTVAVEKSVRRSFQERTISLAVNGEASITFKGGVVTIPISFDAVDVIREQANSVNESFAYAESETDQLERLKGSLHSRLVGRVRTDLKQMLQKRERIIAAEEVDPIKRRDANARLVLYGAALPSGLADLKFRENEKIRWLEPFDIPFATIDHVQFNRAYGHAPWRFDTGFDSIKLVLGSRYVEMTDLSVQPDRQAFGLELGFRFPYLSLETMDDYDPFGWVIRDEYSATLSLGARTSTAYQYPVRNDDGEEDAFYYSGDTYAQVLVGYRAEAFGLMVGIRPRAMFHEIGDAGSGSVGIPVIGRMELSLSSRYPVVVQAWGFSPFADKEAKGVEVQLTIANEWNLAGKALFLDAETRVGGIKDSDIVDLNRRKNLVVGFSLEYVPDLRDW